TNDTPDDCEPDCDGDGTPDDCGIAAGSSDDCNNNGIPDECELALGSSQDCNTNGRLDSCDITNGTGVDCNSNSIPDACDLTTGASTDVNTNNTPDDCEPDVRIAPVVTLIDPSTTSEVRSALPASLDAVARGSTFFLEIWASDVGEINTGLTSVYVDISFCTPAAAATGLNHGTIFTTFPSGTILANGVDEFGGSNLSAGNGVEPDWVRVGWIVLQANAEAPNCPLTHSPSSSGVGAFNRGLILGNFVELGVIDFQITPAPVSYDLDGDGFIGVGDLALFAGSWLLRVPPADSAHDFDCDGFVGPGDLSWFATGWMKNANDPTILFPPCPTAPLAPEFVAVGIDIDYRLVAVTAQSASDTTTTLPTSVSNVALGGIYFIEVWTSDIGAVNTGLTSAYVDMGFPSVVSLVQSILHSNTFTVFTSGMDNGQGTIEELGGSVLPGGVGIEPDWIRVAIVVMQVTGSAPHSSYSLSASSTGTAALARGVIPWNDISLGAITLSHGIAGDIDSDNDRDGVDVDLFVAVLLGLDTDPAHLVASDFNGDAIADGDDIQGFVSSQN
ncbi:MAG: hypothetical protein V3T70_06735, partial [Phycisphaerae bacterium]